MTYYGIDLAGLADYEIEAGAPGIWPSWVIMPFFRTVEDAFAPRTGTETELDGRLIDSLTVRARDPRIDEVFDRWRSRLISAIDRTEGEAPHGDHLFHGRRVNVVFPDLICQFAVIPKSLGMPNLEEDDATERRYPLFDPAVYHGGGALVFDWLGGSTGGLSGGSALKYGEAALLRDDRALFAVPYGCTDTASG